MSVCVLTPFCALVPAVPSIQTTLSSLLSSLLHLTSSHRHGNKPTASEFKIRLGIFPGLHAGRREDACAQRGGGPLQLP